MSGVFTSFLADFLSPVASLDKTKQTHTAVTANYYHIMHRATGLGVMGLYSNSGITETQITETLLWQSVTSSLRPKDAVVLAGVQKLGAAAS